MTMQVGLKRVLKCCRLFIYLAQDAYGPLKCEKMEAEDLVFLVIILGLRTIKRGCSLKALCEIISCIKHILHPRDMNKLERNPKKSSLCLYFGRLWGLKIKESGV
jgi:hypothetical protein